MAMSLPAKAWTLEELHRLPDDGNKYEVIRGDLFVTPPPSADHEEMLARLSAILTGYVEKHGLGKGAAEYWVLDGEQREIRVIRRGVNDVIARDALVWRAVTTEPLILEIALLFG